MNYNRTKAIVASALCGVVALGGAFALSPGSSGSHAQPNACDIIYECPTPTVTGCNRTGHDFGCPTVIFFDN